ncbi:Rieske 2Fe-2S domain-containing protein [Halostella sp. JP-L12]|uniref:Rieske (2Fe-2S) protein n=1 Tax=Halostella TaxID=1843185 RepID=UPI000EF82222|nr:MULTISPECIES: Rieske 2Fe-2S domain-containing protein [Halostella]NHN47726.1 Rieske 2Fe-2S domain-containing protein [Halostella sp. JP-L12]
MATQDDRYERVTTRAELEDAGRKLTTLGGQPIALFHHEGEIRAVNNRCPHMGFPLAKGTVEDGILTCHWHHARFELSCGDTFDPWADDVQTYPVEVRDGDVYVDPHPEQDEPPVEHWSNRLEAGLRDDLRLVVAKSVIGLLGEGVDYAEPVRTGLEFGTEYRDDGWGPGLVVLGAMTNIYDDVRPEDRRRALYRGLLEVADDTSGEPPRFDQPAFSNPDLSKERLKSWFRDTVEVRDDDGAERCLRTAVRTLDPEDVTEILYAAGTDHVYLDAGHTLDFVNKALETLDHVGWEHAEQAIPTLVPRFTQARRSEEQSEWRQPIDLGELVFEFHDDLPDLLDSRDAGGWEAPDGFVDTLLSDDPHEVVDAVREAVGDGATAEQLASRVTCAAARRVVQFQTSNEFNDWNTVHHTFSYCNGVHGGARRVDAPALYRAALHGALSVYLDRFLNTPPARIPDGDPDADPDAIHGELLDAFDEEGNVNAAGRLVADYLAAGGDPAALKQTLAQGLLREDAGFHTLQHVEAGFRQFDLADDPDEAKLYLMAPARYMAAHFPTRRSAEQTFTIAERLDEGERVHES